MKIIKDPEIAREADPSKYKMTNDMYEFGKIWFDRWERWANDFEDIHEISWESATLEWICDYVSGKWDSSDWASYMLDEMSDSSSKFPILESK